MGILSHFFTAAPAEVERADWRHGPAGVPVVLAKRVDPVKIATVDEIVTGADAGLPEEVRDWGEDGPWVFAIRDEAFRLPQSGLMAG